MAVALVQDARLWPRLPREITPDTVAEWVYGVVGDACPLEDAVAGFCEQVIAADRAVEFVQNFGSYVVHDLLDRSETGGRPAQQIKRGVTYTGPLQPDRVNGEGQSAFDTHQLAATPLTPDQPAREPIPQTFPDPNVDTRRVPLAPLKPPKSMLECKWSVGRNHLVRLGDCRAEDLLILEQREARVGATRMRNSTMLRRLRQSLDPGERVRDRWTDAGIMAQFELTPDAPAE